MLTDVFPAVLVKEIRQGLQTRTFAFTLIGQQALMVITILFYLLGVQAANDISAANGLFWICLCIPLLAIMPARGFQTIHEERSIQTLELLFLTRLSARQIVVGKWLALFAQTLLIVVATLPYMLIRYFLGGINISTDVTTTAWLTLASGLLTAVGIGFSAVEHKALRVLIIIAAIFSVFPLLSFGVMSFAVSPSIRGGGPLVGVPRLGMVLSIVALALLVGAYALFFGASLIAPQAENHALPKRLIGLLAIGAITAMAIFSHRGDVTAYLFPLLVILGADALTEMPPRVWSVYARRDGRRWPVPLPLRPFLPGWPSGIVYLLLISVLSWLALSVFGTDVDNSGTLILAMATALLFPLPFIFLMGSRVTRIGPVYVLFQIIHLILCALMITAIETHTIGDVSIAGLFPASTFILAAESRSGWEGAAALLLVVMGLGTTIVFLGAFRAWAYQRRLAPANMPHQPEPAADA